MTSPSPSTISRVREQPASEHGPKDLATRGELTPAPLVPVRRTMIAAGISTAAFIALSVTPYVNQAVTVQTSAGLMLLVTELFWLSAAAMGASFAMLLQASGIMHPANDRRYWIQLVVGVMAGFILTALLPMSELTGLSQPTIAVLGAFLASTAFRMVTGARTPALDGGGDSATADP